VTSDDMRVTEPITATENHHTRRSYSIVFTSVLVEYSFTMNNTYVLCMSVL
jgi:hypothetical protein